MDVFDAAYLGAGASALLAAALPRALADRPFSLPLVFLACGSVAFTLPLGLPEPDPVTHRKAVEHTAEVVVLISLMGAGLALNRPVGRRRWGSTWRLLAIGMPLTILGVALVAKAVLAVPLAAALLLGAVLAPTDPVLASDVQVGEPTDDESDEDEVRFALTSEAGLNDGLAFPFVHAAVALAVVGSGAEWAGEWLLRDVGYKIVAGVVVGYVVGRLFARFFFQARRVSLRLSEHSDGFVALAVTFLAYGVAELARGYGFVAVFVAACTIRSAERAHGYHNVMHGFIEQVERLLTAWVLLLLGGAMATGVTTVTWQTVLVAALLIFGVRPLAALLSLLGGCAGWRERVAIAFFGIRGIGSLYYIAFATGVASFGVDPELLWGVITSTIVLSVVVHGMTATPVMRRLDLLRHARVVVRHGSSDPDPRDVAAERL